VRIEEGASFSERIPNLELHQYQTSHISNPNELGVTNIFAKPELKKSPIEKK
jgi:hypothetical protein